MLLLCHSLSAILFFFHKTISQQSTYGLFIGSLSTLQPEHLSRMEFSFLDPQPPDQCLAPQRWSINMGKSAHLWSRSFPYLHEASFLRSVSQNRPSYCLPVWAEHKRKCKRNVYVENSGALISLWFIKYSGCLRGGGKTDAGSCLTQIILTAGGSEGMSGGSRTI